MIIANFFSNKLLNRIDEYEQVYNKKPSQIQVSKQDYKSLSNQGILRYLFALLPHSPFTIRGIEVVSTDLPNSEYILIP